MCGVAVLADDRFCEVCGFRLAASPVGDPNDGYEIDAGIAGGVSHRGLVHRRNDDALHLETRDGAVVAVVCDGVSSSVAADTAARVAAQTAGGVLGNALGAASGSDPEHAMVAAVAAAQDAVLDVPWEPTDSLAAPSSTFVAAVWDGRAVTVCGIGDSRAYWIGASTNAQLTLDDSWAREAVDAGVMTEKAAEADPRAHAITRWLGADAPDEPVPIQQFEPTEPGRLIVCSDGLWNYAPAADELAALVHTRPADAPPIDVARCLVDAAIAAGGHDNVTVAVVDIEIDIAATPAGDHPEGNEQ
jgi:serine/threonine protein phosphatase PrpC